MIFKQSLKWAMVCAGALGIAWYAGSVTAAPYEAGSGTPLTVGVDADVDNTIDVVTTDAAIGNIGVTGDVGDTATLTMDPTTGTITDDTVGPARIVHETGTGAPATVDVTLAFFNTDLHSSYSNPVNLTCGGCVGTPPDFALDDVLDDLPLAQGDFTSDGTGTTDGTGALSWTIGVTISTIASATPYETGTYTGSFDMEIYY